MKTFSGCHLKKPKSLVVAGMLTAMCVLLGFLKIQIGGLFQISFGFLAIGLLGYLFGPVMAGICAGMADLLSFFIYPTGPFFLGFTLSAVIGGLLYGLILYQKQVRFWRVFLAMLCVGVLVNILLNTLWVILLYGYGYWAILPERIIKNCFTIPLNTVLFYFVLKALGKWEIKR